MRVRAAIAQASSVAPEFTSSFWYGAAATACELPRFSLPNLRVAKPRALFWASPRSAHAKPEPRLHRWLFRMTGFMRPMFPDMF